MVIREPTGCQAHPVRSSISAHKVHRSECQGHKYSQRETHSPTLSETYYRYLFTKGRCRLRNHQPVARPLYAEHYYDLHAGRSRPETSSSPAGISGNAGHTSGRSSVTSSGRCDRLAEAALMSSAIMWSSAISARSAAGHDRLELHISLYFT